MKKKILLVVFFLVYNLFFFNKLFFPLNNPKVIITPEFQGGDSVISHLPLRKVLCEDLKHFKLPFWSKTMSYGYPLLAEGEIGGLNPIYFISCLLFDYKTSFNVSIVLYAVVANVGLFLLGETLGFSVLTNIFLALLYPYIPLLLMNFMQITLVYPLYFIPYIIVGAIKLLKQKYLSGFIWIVIAVFLQFLTSHLQISFISYVTISLFILIFYLVNNKLKKNRKLIVVFLLFTAAWFFGLLLAAPQTFPSYIFFNNSNRATDLFYSYGVHFDQNLNFRNFLTLLSPYINGIVQKGTYDYNLQAHPWEGTIFIYYTGLVCLFLSFLNFLKKNKNKFYLSFIFTIFFSLLIALGRNSPIYFIHSLPYFSAFRFPTRFLLTTMLLLTILSAYGFEKIFKWKVLQILLIVVLSIESYNFFYAFHILYPANQIYKNSLVFDYLSKSKKLNSRIFIPEFESNEPNNTYVNGFIKTPEYYYNFVNNRLLPNINLVYRIDSLIEKIGPLLSRKSYYNSKLFEVNNIDLDAKKASFSASIINSLKISSTDLVVSSFDITGEALNLIDKIKSNTNNDQINIYELIGSRNKISFYDSIEYIATVGEFYNSLEDRSNLTNVLLDSNNIIKLKNENKSLKVTKNIFEDTDSKLRLILKTNKDMIMVVANNYYPEWYGFVDGKSTKIFKANFLYQGMFIAKGEHTIELRYIPVSFYIGILTAGIVLSIMVLLIIYREKLPRLYET